MRGKGIRFMDGLAKQHASRQEVHILMHARACVWPKPCYAMLHSHGRQCSCPSQLQAPGRKATGGLRLSKSSRALGQRDASCLAVIMVAHCTAAETDTLQPKRYVTTHCPASVARVTNTCGHAIDSVQARFFDGIWEIG